MRFDYTFKVLSGLLAFCLASCSGGGGSDGASLRVTCAGGDAFCLIRCDLGCSQSGCSISEIAENQRLKFTFSDRVSAASVTNASVSIRTITGVAPDGDLLVTGSEVTFVPRVRTISGVSSFGFQRNETYIITLAGGPTAPFGVKSESGGASLTKEFSCTVVASRGIADEDQQPPRVELVSPTSMFEAPLDPTIVLRFSELIDTTPLRGSLTAASPIRYTLRPSINTAGALTCNRDAQGLVLLGIPRLSTERVGDHDVTVVTFKPTVQLPGQSCVQVVVTADLRDLSGRQAVPAEFRFFTQAGVSTPLLFTESFNSETNLNQQISGGTWADGARGAPIGYDGRHGSFDPSLGGNQSTEYTWNTNMVTIPASRSLTGQPYNVTDGKFYFTDFVLPAGTTLKFVGPVPPQIFVRGRVNIEGSILSNGIVMTTFNARGTTAPGVFVNGQPGSQGGVGAGSGGAGGNECQGLGPIGCSGTDGLPVQLLAGNGYMSFATGTGGKGSSVNPPDGNGAPNLNPLGSVYRSFFSPGGSGGGFSIAGSPSTISPFSGLQLGAFPPAGIVFSGLSMTPSNSVPGYASWNHYIVGGSGGGGGGSHAFGTFTVTGDIYVAGAGGSGGGGAMAFRAGNDLRVAGSARLEARGGAGVLITGADGSGPNNTNWGVCSPGGGGSGGSFLLQSARNLNVLGPIDTSGGDGSRTGQVFITTINVPAQAGAGSPGFYRLEAVGNLSVGGTNVPVYDPAVHSGPLVDRDPFSGCVSLWRSSNRVFPPQWIRYELDVDTDDNGSVDITYTDSGAAGTVIANDISTQPVTVQFQGAPLSQGASEPVAGTAGQWRYGVGNTVVSGIVLDSATGFRFMLTFNNTISTTTVVRALRVFART